MPVRALRRTRFVGPAVVVAVMANPSIAHGQASDPSLTEAEVARLLVSVRPEEVRRGIRQLGMRRGAFRLPGVPPEKWGPEIRAAVVRAVEQEAWLDAPEDWGELHVELYEAVAVIGEMGDPIAIAPLAGFGMTGFPVYETLVYLGEPALREVIATATAPGRTRTQRSARRSAFVVMAMFVDERGPQGLGAGLLSEIRSMAASALDDRELVMEAIDLSVLLEDAELAGTVERLATTPSSVQALGITDSVRIAEIRERARVRLEDPTPYWYGFEWWTDRRLERCVDRDSRDSRVCRRLLANIR